LYLLSFKQIGCHMSFKINYLVITVYLIAFSGVYGVKAAGGSAASTQLASIAPQAAAATTLRIVIGRPNSYGYSEVDPQWTWIAGLTEEYLYTGLSFAKPVLVISREQLSDLLPKNQGFDKRISKQNDLTAAKAVAATHLIYTEYEKRSDKEILLHFAVIAVNGTNAQEKTITLSPTDYAASLAKGLKQVAAMLNLDGELPGGETLLAPNQNQIKRLGEALVKAASLAPTARSALAAECEKTGAADKRMLCATAAASRLYAEAGQYRKAAELLQSVIDKSETGASSLWLTTAGYHRRAGNFAPALAAVGRIERTPGMAGAALLEKGMICLAGNDLTGGRQQFNALLAVEPDNAEAAIALARLSFLQGAGDQTKSALATAARLRGDDDGTLACRLGDEFIQTGNRDAARNAYSLCVKLTPDNAAGWKSLGDLQLADGLKKEAAESYLQLFHLDYLQYRDYVEKAGSLFEQEQLIDRARSAYTDFLQMQPGDAAISIRLARLELGANNCAKVRELLEPLTVTEGDNREVQSMLTKCPSAKIIAAIREQERQPSSVSAGDFADGKARQQQSRRHVYLSIPTGVIGLAGILGGMAVNFLQIDPKYKEYNASDDAARALVLHNDLSRLSAMRAVFYSVGGVAMAGLAINIAIPEIRR
jgi:tetratricopeptide (TPR) repeat protein